MFVAFLGNNCPQIYIPTNVYASICIIFTGIYEIELATKEITSPRTMEILATHDIDPPKIKNDSTYSFISYTESLSI